MEQLMACHKGRDYAVNAKMKVSAQDAEEVEMYSVS